MLDSTYTVETPEGVELPIAPAGPCIRCLAFLLDVLIRVVIYSVCGVIISLLAPQTQLGFYMIMIFLLEWFYPVFFEVLYDGATPGKRVFGLKVIREDGTPVSLYPSLIRNLLIIADFMPSLFIGGAICMALNDRFRRLGDFAAGTLVVHLDRVKRQPKLSEDRTLRPPPFAMTQEEQKAIVSFAERRSKLSTARAEELATLLGPTLTDQVVPAEKQLLQIANGLMGRS